MATHVYEGSHASRSTRKWNKLTAGQPRAVGLERLEHLVSGKPAAPVETLTVRRSFNPPRLKPPKNGRPKSKGTKEIRHETIKEEVDDNAT